MPNYTTINKSTDYFNTKLYTGNGSTQSITGVGFQPDLTWVKVTSETGSHRLADAVRGNTKYSFPNGLDAESTISTNITSWNADGFALGNGSINENTRTYASWNWLASNTTASNTDGSITSTVSANTTSGFSIVTYTGTGANATIGHGLGNIPRLIIVKRRDGSTSWTVLGNGENQPGSNFYGKLNSKDGFADSDTRWNDTDPTTSVFTVGTDGSVNASGGTYVAYVFSEVTGFFKAGLYQGNGNADGAFIYTGGKPSLILMRPNIADKDWYLMDNKRNGFNSSLKAVYPNDSSAGPDLSGYLDIYSNGFKVTTTDNSFNGLGNSYQYWCWMQSIVGSNNIPATAR